MNLGPRGIRFFFNLYPPFFFSRARIQSISPDWREIVVKLRKSLLTRNYVGTTFGGSMYAAADPHFMIMLIKILGICDYIIWDKGAVIDFKKPARSTLTYRFVITDADLQKIQDDLAANGKSLPEFVVNGIDEEGEVCIAIKKLLYVRRKENR